jgi:signal transduction histidine kinase
VPESFKDAVNRLSDGLESATGEEYLERFVAQIAGLFAADCAAIARLEANGEQLQTLALYCDGRISDNTVWVLKGSPGAEVTESASPCIFRTGVQDRFPDDQAIKRAGAFCYVGIPLFTTGGDILGLVVLTGRQPIAGDLLAVEVVQLFADRVVAEIERLDHDAQLQQHRQLLEDRIDRYGEDLKKARQELEVLSYAVSHDLRGPLRAILGFSEILKAEYGDRLGETAGDYLRRIRNNVQHMDELLHALLILSRVARHPLSLTQVDLSGICRRSIERLRQRDTQRQVSVSIQEGVYACSDSRLMTIALDHLIDNAWKFTGGTDSANIEFSADPHGNVTVYRLADNGAGFDMRYVDRLFELFQRLHGQQLYAGIGAGLATVKRIIERHGGAVWAEAQQGAGATFYFSLPSQPPESGCEPAITAPV